MQIFSIFKNAFPLVLLINFSEKLDLRDIFTISVENSKVYGIIEDDRC